MSTMSSGAHVLIDGLQRAGVECVFGLPGTQNLQVYEALRRSPLRSVVCSDELAATFMASGYARASGRLGVVTTIPGPGLTYALTGLAEAHADSTPLLLVTLRQTDTGRRFQLQQLDIPALVRPVCKGVISVLLPERLPAALAEAILLARTGEPGPVVLEVAAAVLGAEVPSAVRGLGMPAANGGALPDVQSRPEELAALVRRVALARYPVVYAGQGAQGSARALQAWCEARGVPVLTTCSGRGVLPESHPLALCKDFSYGLGETLPSLLERCDLVLALGVKFAHNGSAGFRLQLPRDRLVRVDTSSVVLESNYPAAQSLVARCEDVLAALHADVDASRSAWGEMELATLRERLAHEAARPIADEPRLRPTGVAASGERIGAFLTRLQRMLPDDRILTTDSGQNQALTRKYAHVSRPGGLIAPADFQSMGFGLPAAIGASLALPGVSVLACIGDGGLLQTASDLFTAVREGLNLTVLVFDDGKFGYIERQQVEQFGATSSVQLGHVDLEALAAAYGCTWLDATEMDVDAIARAIAQPGVKVLGVGLRDAPSMRVTRVTRGAREGLARVLGPALRQRLKRWLRR